MQQQQLTLSVQETASQGLIAAKCIAQPWLTSSVYNQSIQQQTENRALADYPEIALSIAQNIQQQERTDCVLVQLYQGSTEKFQQKEKSIILFSLLLTPSGVLHKQRSIAGSKTRKQNQAAIYTLDLLRRFLQGKPV